MGLTESNESMMKINNPKKKLLNDMGSHFTEEEAHMTNKHMKEMLSLTGNKKVINQD